MNPFSFIAKLHFCQFIPEKGTWYLAFGIFFFHFSALGVELPTGLVESEIPLVIRTLGINTSSKLLTNPYPLGGYSGIEIGLSLEVINTTDLGRLGDTTSSQRELRYPRLTIGKGLFFDIDAFVHFIPYNENSDISDYGGILRWNFYQTEFLPIHFSAAIHGNVINIEDTFINETLGFQLISGINVDNFSLYGGWGRLEAKSEFNKKVLDPTVSLNGTQTYLSSLQESHTFIGMAIHFQKMFFSSQIDKYREPVYSAKLGLRF